MSACRPASDPLRNGEPRLALGWWLIIVSASLTLELVGGPQAVAQSPPSEFEARYLAGLRSRQLFELAESYCQHRYESGGTSAGARGAVAVEWIRTLAAHALSVPEADRAPLLQQAHEITRRFVNDYRDHSQTLIVRAQDALADFAAGELARQEMEVRDQVAAQGNDEQRPSQVSTPPASPIGAPPATRVPGQGESSALKLSRQAVRALEQLDQDLTQLLPQRFRRPATAADEWTAEELAGLQHQLRLQAARALRNMALCYAASSDDRLSTLNRALQFLEKSQNQIAGDDPLALPLLLERVAALRLLGKYDIALRSLEQLPEGEQAAKDRGDVSAERARCWLAQGELEQVQRTLQAAPHELELQSPELALARLEYLIARWRAASRQKQVDDASRWQEQAIEQLQKIEQEQESYWRQRGELLLVTAGGPGGSASLTVSSTIMARTADRFYREGRWEEAVQEYDRAVATARREAKLSTRNSRLGGAQSFAEAAFPWAYRAALVLQENKRHAEAAERLQRLSLEFPQHLDSPDAHLQAAWNWAQQLRDVTVAARGNEHDALRGSYLKCLEEQVSQWPRHETANQARAWIAVYREESGELAQALEAYAAIATKSPLYETALRGLARVQQQCWTRARGTNLEADKKERAAAADHFTQVARQAASRPEDFHAENLAAVRYFAATTAAKYHLQAPQVDYRLLEELIRPLSGAGLSESAPNEAALNEAGPNEAVVEVSASERATLQSLLMVALAGQPGRLDEARTLLRKALATAAQTPNPGSSGARTNADTQPSRQNKEDQAAAGESLRLILGQLEQISRAAPVGERTALARLQLELLEPALIRSLTADERLRAVLERQRAAALATAGERSAALTELQRILAEKPADGDAREQLADLWLSGNEKADWQRALGEYRKIAAASKARTSRWYRAKLGVARAQAKTGDTAGARQLIEFLRATPPGLAGTPSESDFEQLHRELSR
ncbi:MAG: hypothetical protein ACKOBW_13910 [Planctomycetota bacterium]